MLVSYWKHCFPRGSKNPKGAELPYKDADLEQLLQSIKNGYWRGDIERIRAIEDKDERTALKQKLLHVFKVSGTFIGGDSADIVTYNGLLQIDIDNVPLGAVAMLKELICEYPFVLSAFFSPSMGLKAIVRTSPPDMPKNHWEQWHDKAWEQVETYFNDKLQPFKLDRQTRPISKNLFVSYDADLYYNADCIAFPLEPITIEEPKQQPTIDYKKGALPSYTPNSGSGRIDDADYIHIYHHIKNIFSEWEFVDGTKDGIEGYWSPCRLNGEKVKDKRKTWCTMLNGKPVFQEMKNGQQSIKQGLFEFWGRGSYQAGMIEAKNFCGKFRR